MSSANKPWLKHYHELAKPETHIENLSLTQFLLKNVREYGDWKAITFYNRSWTFQELYGISERFASCLHQSGFKKGDRLGIMLPNTPHYLFALFGTFRLGGIVTQVNPMYVEREIEYILNDSGAETMVVLDMLYPRVKSVQANTPLKKIIVVSLGTSETPVELAPGDILFDDFMKAYPMDEAPPVQIDPADDVAVLQYSGGTTGASKGVMLTHRNIIANCEQSYDYIFKILKDVEGVPDNAKVINVLPMFHIFGLTCVSFFGIRAGYNQIILPRFDVKEVLETFRREQPFQFSGVPTMYIALNAVPNIEEYGLGNTRIFNSGGAAMPVEQLHLFEKRVGAPIYEGYGLSEAAPVTHFTNMFAERKVGSIGLPFPSTEAKIVDVGSGEHEVPVGEIGELVIRGPQVMKGYWNREEETKITVRDGWLYTGDLGRMDEDGYFYIVDRKKDLIIASGFNIYPREIEEVIYEHPAVQECIVLGIPDEYRGESVAAYVALKEVAAASEADLIEHCKKHLASFKVPRLIEIREQLPKSAVGKLLKRALRDELNKK
ncbi:long-chain-fatty-acid--CoA ligase [Brevibacillus dissolubilis]|uniref:long-chain-fatty-acid--CoA ligase n=1 Tax=Brevibacillus dissolubilis TaxID=1844116 RepID=UPI001115F254|nr:long-chain fatty acid--CoA ligase [Brevibacillus dissolubilis]